MNKLILEGLNTEQREKYLILKESQELLYQVICHLIHEKSHTLHSQAMLSKLMQLDATMELLEVSSENAAQCLDDMSKEEMQALLKSDKQLYKATVSKPH